MKSSSKNLNAEYQNASEYSRSCGPCHLTSFYCGLSSSVASFVGIFFVFIWLLSLLPPSSSSSSSFLSFVHILLCVCVTFMTPDFQVKPISLGKIPWYCVVMSNFCYGKWKWHELIGNQSDDKQKAEEMKKQKEERCDSNRSDIFEMQLKCKSNSSKWICKRVRECSGSDTAWTRLQYPWNWSEFKWTNRYKHTKERKEQGNSVLLCIANSIYKVFGIEKIRWRVALASHRTITSTSRWTSEQISISLQIK